MKKVSLNFFGEKANINLPTTLGSLRNCIADQFMFDPVDAAEIVISYVKDFAKTIIKTDLDYKQIFNLGIKELNLDISESSRLYQEKKKNATDEASKQLAELEQLRKNTEALKEEKKKAITDGKADMEKLKGEIMSLRVKHRKMFHEVNDSIKNSNRLIQENEKKIEEMETKLNLPHQEKKEDPLHERLMCRLNELRNCKLEKKIHHCKERLQKLKKKAKKKEKVEVPAVVNQNAKVKTEENQCYNFKNRIYQNFEAMKDYVRFNPRDITEKIYEKFSNMKFKSEPKEAKEEIPKVEEPKVEQKDIVHPHVFCDGCHMFPLRGMRYKCACCRNFDYCEECEEKYSEIHQHPFVCIRDPKMRFYKLDYPIKKEFPPFDRRIHN